MSPCEYCGKALPENAEYCSSCGTKVVHKTAEGKSTEQVLGTVLFGGYYKDICFTDRSVYQFETMRDRYKFFVKALGPKPLVVERGGNMTDVLPFVKTEILREQIASIELKNHGRFGRGYIKISKTSGELVELARIDVDVSKDAFGELAQLVNGIYPEIKKTII